MAAANSEMRITHSNPIFVNMASLSPFDIGVVHNKHFHDNLESTAYIEPCYQHLNVVFGVSSSKHLHDNFNTFDTYAMGTVFVPGAAECGVSDIQVRTSGTTHS